MLTTLYEFDYPRAFGAGLMICAGVLVFERTADLIVAPFMPLAVAGHAVAATVSTIVLVILYVSLVAAASFWYFNRASGGFLNGLLLGTLSVLLVILGHQFENSISALIFDAPYVVFSGSFVEYALLIAVSASIGYLSSRSQLGG